MVCEPCLAGAGEAEPAGVADRRSAAGVLVVGGDVGDAGVQAHAVVAGADGGQLAVQIAGIGELAEVAPFVLEVPEEALDRRLVGRYAGRPKCVAIACSAMNSRVEPDVICAPLSETASRTGWSASGAAGSASRSARPTMPSSRPSASKARVNRTCTCSEVASGQSRWSIHLRLTRSTTAMESASAPGMCRAALSVGGGRVGRERNASPREAAGGEAAQKGEHDRR
jgi:hypothetical protein